MPGAPRLPVLEGWLPPCSRPGRAGRSPSGGALAGHQAADVLGLGGIAAEQAVRPSSQTSPGLVSGLGRRLDWLVGVAEALAGRRGEQRGKLAARSRSRRGRSPCRPGQRARSSSCVPAGGLSSLLSVRRKALSGLWSEVVCHDDRHRLAAQALRGGTVPRVAGHTQISPGREMTSGTFQPKLRKSNSRPPRQPLAGRAAGCARIPLTLPTGHHCTARPPSAGSVVGRCGGLAVGAIRAAPSQSACAWKCLTLPDLRCGMFFTEGSFDLRLCVVAFTIENR